jgi:hypothetical protein
VINKFDPRGVALADRHYSRRKIGSPQFMPPGQTLILMTCSEDAIFGWWRPKPGVKAMNNLDGWTCTIFRNESPVLSSELILEAEVILAYLKECGPDGLITYVWDAKLKSTNPGYCFKCAGWQRLGTSKDGRKTRLGKPWSRVGISATTKLTFQ